MGIFFLAIISYFIGNISGGLILSKVLFKKDIREFGSGNTGTTNALRVFGKKIGILTFIIDFLKGIIVAYIGGKIYGDIGMFTAGLAVVLGHDWPIVYGFKGGKGIATSFGVLMAISPLHILAVFGVFLIIVAVSRYVSLGSVSVAVLCILVGIYFIVKKDFFYGGLLYIILAVITIFKHRGNIYRLLTGNESRIK
ncbi:MAG: glycerol-3-phosphate 1-O-acyltransferase PlsY [Miniphocaeibacter sp.]|uniref:glycerol-3-phosphate 1-O-acyltransferase PlsY n=1 Tax=Miniphocaeibacter sp. TaxID=3100973 RepID=UPI00181090EF|nr:glycerol-3-phosphate 1-O-acyltransferase PlsY [Gallicola sp.]